MSKRDSGVDPPGAYVEIQLRHEDGSGKAEMAGAVLNACFDVVLSDVGAILQTSDLPYSQNLCPTHQQWNAVVTDAKSENLQFCGFGNRPARF